MLERYSLRDLILAIILVGTVGLIAELVLQEHTESWQQWIPLVLLGFGLVATAMVRLRAGRGSLRIFSAVMVSFLAAGAVGVYLHLAGNMEFIVERTPEIGGTALAYVYRHPSWHKQSTSLPE